MAIMSKDSQGDVQSPGLGKHFRKLGANLSLILAEVYFCILTLKNHIFKISLSFYFMPVI